ncbi:hypothetical protein L226DRAFT_144764 [Lentinus tigrinus ALCF2SS1-7]|uniref:F-box domain-containing protein n=1 Tax=Lentinus tigrinus ALCF2SS1-6 TaxID=1328759 RepID=A0A5C2S5Y3_9APHY|nr:hypothetical protein L227DRAFT_183364 [Lentinus tigrinus ALCF2SS1-6]RPD72725.1 hypothetical protein L226DRAFT_144764 [Lentinus tigrinus ALCF2SS1-7]
MAEMHSSERTQPRSCVVPGEVTDNIIDYLHDDTNALRAGALVSRAWLPSCQHHLFSTTFCQLTQPGRGLTDFLAWLAIARYAAAQISTLIIDGDLNVETSEARPKVYIQDVVDALEPLTSLVDLTIGSITLFPRHHTNQVSHPPTHRTLGTFTIGLAATFDNTSGPISQILSLFSEVEHLVVGDLECMWTPDIATAPSLGDVSPAHHTAQVTRSLSIVSATPTEKWTGYQGVVDLCRHSEPKWQLKELLLAFQRVAFYSETLGRLLPDFGTSLTRLSVQLPM